MPLVLIGVLLFVCKLAGLGPVADWSWWIVALPFGLAAAWWQFSDVTGLTQRKAMDKMDRRKAERRDRALASLGLDHRHEKQVARAREDAAERRASADPTQADRPAAEDPTQRRDSAR
jgi:small Trp-rich protein